MNILEYTNTNNNKIKLPPTRLIVELVIILVMNLKYPWMCFIQWSTTILVYTTTNNDKINSLQQEGEACSEVESEDDD